MADEVLATAVDEDETVTLGLPDGWNRRDTFTFRDEELGLTFRALKA